MRENPQTPVTASPSIHADVQGELCSSQPGAFYDPGLQVAGPTNCPTKEARAATRLPTFYSCGATDTCDPCMRSSLREEVREGRPMPNSSDRVHRASRTHLQGEGRRAETCGQYSEGGNASRCTPQSNRWRTGGVVRRETRKVRRKPCGGCMREPCPRRSHRPRRPGLRCSADVDAS